MKKIILPESRPERIKVYVITAVVAVLTLCLLWNLFDVLSDFEKPDMDVSWKLLKQFGNGYKK